MRCANPRALLLKGSVMYLLADKKDVGSEPDALVKQYALHRIRAARITGKAVTRCAFNLKKHLEKAEHEVGNRHGIRVRLRVSANLAKRYSTTVPLSSSRPS